MLRMAKTHHTVIFVPHARAKLRKWRVTNLQIGLATGAFLLLTSASLAVTWAYFNTSVSPAEIERLTSENQKLREVNSTFESSIGKLQGQLAEYEERTRDLAIVAGIDSLGDSGGGGEAGVGGPTALDGDLYDLDTLSTRAGRLDDHLDAVEVKLNERLRWISSTPAITPVKGILTSGFGRRVDPLTHGRGHHHGIDISAPAGQPVRATADGIVLRAADLGGLGKAVHLAHGFGVATRYGHLSRIDVKAGQQVKRGDVIGLVGNTGRSTGNHLHYEVHIDGEPVDPIAYILDNGAAPF